MREQPGADGKVWWNDRQPRFTVLVLGIYALVILGFELGLGRGDRIGLAGGGAAVYALMIAFYGLLANVSYELVAKAEALSPPTPRGTTFTEITGDPGTARWRRGGRLPVSRRAAA